MQDTKPLQLSNTSESVFTLPLTGQEKCWMSMSYEVNLCRPNSFGTINDYLKIPVFSTSEQQHLLTCSQVFILCTPTNRRTFLSLLPSLRKLLLSWNEDEGRGVAAQFRELSCSLYAFFPALAHHIWVVWRTGAVVPVTCINRSRWSVPSCIATWEILLRSLTLSPLIAIWSHPRISAMWHRSVSQA